MIHESPGMQVGGRTVHLGTPVVRLQCHTCMKTKNLPGATHQMTEKEYDSLARSLGWSVEDGGLNPCCPECV